ncbi:hypothetical protein M3Y95_01159300 [Aphelenchoides besseyi]|nr:hypothetical protein M3Y95_01159300 [Aphelenchoides besseyi]
MANLSCLDESKLNVWGRETDFVSVVHLSNLFGNFVFSPISSILLFYMIIFKSPVMFRGYQVVLLFANTVDVSFMANKWFTSFPRTEGGCFVFIPNWPTLPLTIQWINFSYSWSCMGLESGTVVLEFWFRFVLIKTRKPPSSLQLLCVCFLIIGASGTSSLITIAYYFSNNVDQTTQPFVIFDAVKDPWGRWLLPQRRYVIFGSYGLTILFAILSVHTLKRQSMNFSAKAKRLLSEFTLILYLKSIAPAFMVVFPSIVRYTNQTWKIENWIIDEVINSCYAWLPFMNSTLSLLLIGHYRRVMIRAIKCLSFNSSRVQTISTS